MGLELNTSIVPEDQELGEQRSLEFAAKPGRCHAVLTEFAEYGDTRNGRHIFKWEIVAHEHEAEVGKVLWDYCSDPSPNHSDGGVVATQILLGRAVALGLETPESLKACRSENRSPNTDFASAAGRTACLSLKIERFNNEDRVKVQASFHVNDPRAKSYPKSDKFAAGTNSQQPAAPATSQQPASAPANPFATNQPSPV